MPARSLLLFLRATAATSASSKNLRLAWAKQPAGHLEEPLDFGVKRRPSAAGGPDDVSARV